MSTPTLQFSNLCLPDDNPDQRIEGDMRFDRTTLEERKVIVRDIIASFEPRDLPSELFSDETLQRITAEQGNRRSSEWTIHDDLKASLMQWCCHDPGGWTLLSRMHGPAIRALTFEQKVERRFEEQFEAYDALFSTPPGPVNQVRGQVLEICDGIRMIVDEVEADINTRTGSQYNAAKILLDTFRKVCGRSTDVPFVRRSGRLEGTSASAGAETVPTLYQGLIGNVTTPFILDALQTVQEKWPRSLGTEEAQTLMRGINELLVENGAPRGYLNRFQALMRE
ncbi:hypothetical protein CLCR_00924 [Cladophialophora carrionii]|uniref:Uncharacterized protein n=1 Tax=Cladophialophora carrionii TaxID=86049 RepID=A0A1C1D1C4_9EURO|nr:hypothetical protein CLCR_00924 [Cladophialophora carrionii]